ncbi:BREX-1 system adenine-specific DNA-methyltransferase PglX [Vibrio sp. Y42_MX_L11]|uniref:BREX-1 system adenine-specific DNA-methyltransferase PglX n=1 Tax=Vibrio sp. Y42_MX_L11 TaxID=2957765 RepID=UPI0020A289F6|nr:BREX-1 system adenine-specific DNA-methyltransferase PglX [Vibrio sp. Y42_MX_L11]
MNTNKLKAYAPKARVAFMEAVKSRAAKLGIFEDRINDITLDGDSAIIEKEVYTRKQGQQRNQLVQRIKALGTHDGKFVHKDGFNQFINETAFTWFNRLTAIRYMEVNEYLDHGFRVLSKAEGALFGEGFEILNSAADVADELGLDKDQIIDMVLDGNKEEELYRTLLLAQCHQLSEAMPFMFEKLDDATELLLPDNLTKTDSILKDLVNDIPEDNWKDSETGKGQIEVIGWLYQFYISEHKDAVIGKVVKREDIPAATQLFTPNWIVKYLVQNSLGRQWLATYPDSELKDKMEYYITPAEQSDDVIEQLKAITPTSIDPEEIKVLDPACGSGHILVEVYEVLREIYLERGYRLREIPELILTKNIYGLDIDDRAAQMAAFAVMMKAREDDKRIFSRDIKLNIHSIQSTENLNINQLWADLDLDGNKQTGSMGDLFADTQAETIVASPENKAFLELLQYLVAKFLDGKNLGALIEIESCKLQSIAALRKLVQSRTSNSNPTIKHAAMELLPLLNQAYNLALNYCAAIGNPPYMGSGYFNESLKNHVNRHFPSSKSELYTVFVERSMKLLKPNSHLAMITIPNWMFLSSFEKFRKSIIDNFYVDSLIHNGRGVWGSDFGSCSFVLRKTNEPKFLGTYKKLFKVHGSISNSDQLQTMFFKSKPYLHDLESFNNIPGQTFSYWEDKSLLQSFRTNPLLGQYFFSDGLLKTGNNDKYVRYFWEIDSREIGIGNYIFMAKGGDAKDFYGNDELVVKWDSNSRTHYKKDKVARIPPNYVWEKQGISWSKLTVSRNTFRILPEHQISETVGPCIYLNDNSNISIPATLAYLKTPTANRFLKLLNPTVSLQTREVLSLPYIEPSAEIIDASETIYSLYKSDWLTKESSYEFVKLPILTREGGTISTAYDLQVYVNKSILNKVKNIEFNINKYYKSSVSTPNNEDEDIEHSDITLLCNPDYLYSSACKLEQNNKFRCRNVSDLISYSVGCMMGRYSLDRDGLVYAYSGNNGFKELVEEGAWKTFPADDDGIVPLADEDWVFEDDATTLFREFVKTVWGDEHLQENLDFVAESLCLDAIKAKKGESSIDTIRRYFSTQFYKDHLKTYKKRPIYWLFSSGKAKAFECLVYLHRYNEGTLSRMRTEYVTPLMGKLESRKNILEDSKATASGAELRAIDKELKTIEKKQAELVTFDEELKHLAEMKISLDLDDGVKVNYGKFGNLLADVKAIHGKNPEVIK